MQYELSKEENDYLKAVWEKVQSKMLAVHQRVGTSLPYIAEHHRYQDIGDQHLTWWTNGFWVGTLWQLYNATHNQDYLKTARAIELRLDGAFKAPNQLDHDVGFMWLNAAVSDFTITQNPQARERGLQAAEILANRYHVDGQYLLAWNGADKQGQIIVDCFMNLPLLYWASSELENPKYAEIATHHAYTAMHSLVREDGSVNHIAVFDSQTGTFKDNLGGQGYGEGSAWSRGQAWAIYGLTLAFRNTDDIQFLNQAKRVAHFFMANIAMSDYVSVIDFRAPNKPIYRDTTATSIAICGLLELVKYLPKDQQSLYSQFAFKMFTALTENFCNFNLADDDLLDYGSAKYHRVSDREVPIIYGDTFYVEALLRFLELDLKIY